MQSVVEARPTARVALLGRQGSGKGTQGQRLAGTYDMSHLSTGELLRRAVADGEPLGRRVAAFLEAGDLVPDELICEIVASRIAAGDGNRGVVLDGFPRTVAQAHLLDSALGSPAIDLVVELTIDERAALHRLLARRVCPSCGTTGSAPTTTCPECGEPFVRRSDDSPDAIAKRFALYDELTEPVVDWYRQRGRLVSVDATGTADAVFTRLLTVVRASLTLDLTDTVQAASKGSMAPSYAALPSP